MAATSGTVASIERAIVCVRGMRVMLADDLARLYGVDVRVLNQAVKRNRARFPTDLFSNCRMAKPDS